MFTRSSIAVALIATSLMFVTGSTAPGEAQAAESAPAHPYSDPVWSPVRNPTRISCVNTNCPGPFHGYDAIDLVGSLGDPIYASGAGIAHIGGVAPGCVSGTPTRGTWVWIDHGPAGQSRYHHLDSILIADGQYVTPRDQIGTMGSSGDTAPCETYYLHMERRDSAESTTRLPILDFFTCASSGLLHLPDDLGYPTWDDVPAQQFYMPPATNACMPTNWDRTPDRPDSVSVSPAVGAMTVRLPDAPNGIDDVRVRLQLFHPSTGEFGSVVEQSAVPSTSSVSFDNLLINRLYRAMVSYHNEEGWSAWSAPVQSETGFLPATPEYRESFSTATTISYKWFRGTNSDADYTVAIRRGDGERWDAWTYVVVPSTELSHRFRDLIPGAMYQVTVRADNEFGASQFAQARTITTVCHTTCNPPPVYPTLQPAVRLSQQP